MSSHPVTAEAPAGQLDDGSFSSDDMNESATSCAATVHVVLKFDSRFLAVANLSLFPDFP